MNILCKATVSARNISKQPEAVVSVSLRYILLCSAGLHHKNTELLERDEKETVTFKFQAEEMPSSAHV